MTDATTPPPKAKPWGLAVLATLFLVLMCAGAVLAPPPVRTANAPHQFDAEAARARLERILGDGAPHPIDSAAQDVVRAAVLREIEALGFQPEVRERFACRPQPRGPLIDCALVRNIVFSIGPEGGPALLTATHYDSVPAAPGASDAGIGIAALLELARLLNEESLTRRVIFLISDGEEPALLGAYVFAREDSDMVGVQSLLNLEARGTRGPAIFFESNQPNAGAVAAYANAPRPLANSVMADVYALMSNSTDVSALTRPGLDVINIALLDGFEDYHTPQDSLASFNTRSLQHMGDMALGAARGFATHGAGAQVGTRVYTDIVSRAFVSAPAWAAQAALGLSMLIAAFAFWRAGGEKRWAAFAAPIVIVVGAALLAAGAGFAISALKPNQDFWFAYPEPARAWCALLALVGVALTLMALGVRNAAAVGAAGAFWFALLGFAASFALPGTSILFAIPASLYALGAVGSLFWGSARSIGAGAAAVAAFLIWAPTLYLVELALGFMFPFANTALIALVALTVIGAVVHAQGAARWRSSVAVLSLGAVLAFGASAYLPSASPQRPRPLNVVYFFDADADEARVLAGSALRPLPDALAAAFPFAPQTILPGDRFDYWAAPVDAETAPTPRLEALSAAIVGERVVTARLRMNGAYRAMIRIPSAARPLRAQVNAAPASFADTGGAPHPDFYNLACQGRACDGAEIVVALDAAGERGAWSLIGQTPGYIPAASRRAIAARGAAATPIQFGDGALTLSTIEPE